MPHLQVSDLLVHGLVVATEMDYAAGAWASAVELADIGLLAHAILRDPEEDSWQSATSKMRCTHAHECPKAEIAV